MRHLIKPPCPFKIKVHPTHPQKYILKKKKPPKLTELLHHQLARRRVVEAAGEVVAVPHEQFGTGGDGLHRVEVDLHAVLARRQVLLRRRVGRVDVAHPVGAALVQAVDKVVELAVHVDLQQQQEEGRTG